MNDSVLASGPLTIATQVVNQTNANVQQSREALEEAREKSAENEQPAINTRGTQNQQVRESEESSLNGNGPGGGNAETGDASDPERGNVVNTAA